jgi:carboxymethylenebutenolidase
VTVGIRQLLAELERINDAFHTAVYEDRDVEAAIALTAPGCVLTNLPMATGAETAAGLRRYLIEDLLPHLPADLTFRRVSRTVDTRRLVDEVVVGFRHERPLPWLLPAVTPTQRPVSALAISVIGFEHTSRLGSVESRIVSHRTLWDRSALPG